MNLRLHHLQLFATPAVMLCTCIGLAVCGSAPPITQYVNIPVYLPCVKEAPARPEFEFNKLPLDATDGEKILALARDWPRGRKYEGELELWLRPVTSSGWPARGDGCRAKGDREGLDANGGRRYQGGRICTEEIID